MKKRGILLDRDGTLIDFVRDAELGSVVTAFHPKQLRLLAGVVTGLRLLAEHGFLLAIATNQPGAAKGQVPRDAIERTNEALCEMLRAEGVSIARVAVCLHHPEGGPGGDAALVGPCACRKPAPGLLRSLMADLDLDAGASFMVGDSMSDIEAGRAAGVRTALLFDAGRCDLCAMRPAPGASDARAHVAEAAGDAQQQAIDALRITSGASRSATRPDVVAGRFDEVARAIVGMIS